ncbi:MAG: hypothetical protein DRI90_25705 [Deltaproteobacteria bacterium]|nr:MAG: hypothetical protein DRI90_25705 [Deltaproteobacteria bacterium]
MPLPIPLGSSVSFDATTPVLLLSDLHFGDGSRTDLFARQDGDLVSLLEHWRDQVQGIVFLGDTMDLPQAWSLRRIRTAHPKIWTALRRLAGECRLVFARGNHDWSVDYDALFPGATCCEVVLFGPAALAWHGHQVDLMMKPSAGNAWLKTRVHATLERLAGCRLVPPLERYDSPANRVALALTTLWAHGELTAARVLERAGRPRRAAALEARVRYLARSFIGDPADIFGASYRQVLGAEVDTVVCGHSHLPGVVRTDRGRYVNTGSWACGSRTYALWEDGAFRVLDLDTGQEIGDADYAGLLEPTGPEDLFRWWHRHHKGLLRFDLTD